MAGGTLREEGPQQDMPQNGHICTDQSHRSWNSALLDGVSFMLQFIAKNSLGHVPWYVVACLLSRTGLHNNPSAWPSRHLVMYTQSLRSTLRMGTAFCWDSLPHMLLSLPLSVLAA